MSAVKVCGTEDSEFEDFAIERDGRPGLLGACDLTPSVLFVADGSRFVYCS